MEYTAVTDPKYTSADGKSIGCMVQFSAFSKAVPFHAMATDRTTHGQQIYADLVAGKYGPVTPYVAPATLTPAQQYQAVIAKGINVTSASNAALSATYPLTLAFCASVRSEAQFVSVHNEFSTGGATFDLADVTGAAHAFDIASLVALDRVIARYVAACRQTLTGLLAGAKPAWPTNSVAI